MKKTLKKTAAVMMAVLMIGQIVPALAGTYSSGIVVGGAQGYREMLEIVASKGTYVLVGQTLDLDVNEGYTPSWESADEAIATIGEDGVLEALAAGEVTITAREGSYSATTTVTVIDPDPLMEEVQHEETATVGPEPDGEPDEENKPEEQAPAEKQYAIIVINGESTRYEYDGEEHTLDTFVATSNQDFFDESKVRVVGEIGVSATDCGTYEFKLEETDFAYDDPNVVASFVVNNGWMKIRPANVTIQIGNYTKKWGETDPDYIAGLTVEGLCGSDTAEMLNLQVVREEGEDAGFYALTLENTEKTIGNYRLSVEAGILTIEMPQVKIRSSMEGITEAVAGTEVVLTAEMDGLDTERFSIQWQMGDTPNADSMKDIEGANEPVYTYILDESTAGKYFRVLINLK